MNHEKWNNRDRDTPENIICGIANDGMWFWSLMELQRDTTGIPLDDIFRFDGNMTRNRHQQDKDGYVELVRECQVTCIMELKKAGHTQRRIAEAMQCDNQVISRRVRDHLKATS